MIYPEFSEFRQEVDKENPFSNLYYLDSGECFYVEPVFYTHLRGFKDLREKEFPRIIERMIEVVKRIRKLSLLVTLNALKHLPLMTLSS